MEEYMGEKLVPKRQYTEEFKTEAVRLAQSVGQHEAARRLGVPVATLGNWTRRERNLEATSASRITASSPVKRPVSEMESEITRLRKELASAKLDIEILRKATAYFAKGSR
jgi:transposase